MRRPLARRPARAESFFPAASSRLPYASFERTTPFHRASISFRKFQSISRNRDLSVRYGRMNRKKSVRNLVTPKEASVLCRRLSRRRACPSPSAVSQRKDVFLVSVFPLGSNQAKGWRRLSRWTQAFCAHDFNRRFGRRLRNGRIRRGRHPFNGRAPALRSCGVCNASLFRAYPSVPLFRGRTAVRRRSSARRHPAMMRTEHEQRAPVKSIRKIVPYVPPPSRGAAF
jgi:hypothetical protein